MDPAEKPKRRHADRVPAATVAARTEDILPLVTDGASRREIFAWVRENTTWGPDVCNRTIENYMARAWRLIRERSENSAQHYTEEAIARLKRNYWRASEKGDLSECRQTEESLIKLLGLAKPERWIITLDDIAVQLKRLLAEE
jgi:hypothetical protein